MSEQFFPSGSQRKRWEALFRLPPEIYRNVPKHGGVRDFVASCPYKRAVK